jgi:hypothetical protein
MSEVIEDDAMPELPSADEGNKKPAAKKTARRKDPSNST